MIEMMTHGSLFAGIGGFDEGFRLAGFKAIWQVEKEPFCISVLKTRFPNAERYYDVLKCGHDRIHKLRTVDVLTAGFPCQDLSVAGKRAGLEGTRSGLFWEVVRILGELRPPWFVLENVPGLFSSCEGRDFGIILNALDELGYGLAWRVLNSQFFGVAQRRRRVFIVGRLGKPCPAEVLFESPRSGGDIEASSQAWPGVADPLTSGSGVTGNAPGRRREDDYNLAVAQTLAVNCGKTYDETEGPRNLVAATLPADHRFTTDSCTDNLQPVATLNSGGNSGGFRTEPGEHLVSYALRNDPGGTGQGHNTTYAICKGSDPIHSEGFALPITGRNGDPGTIAHERSQTHADGMRDFAGLPLGLDSARYRALGNAVTVSVAKWIGERIVEAEKLTL